MYLSKLGSSFSVNKTTSVDKLNLLFMQTDIPSQISHNPHFHYP